jgi:alpha-ketoglutarate-dependent taurine dioxygenase
LFGELAGIRLLRIAGKWNARGGVEMHAIATRKLGEIVGAEVLDVDCDRLLDDDGFPAACLDALDTHGVLLFRQLHLDDATQVAFCRRLGAVVAVPGKPIPEITVVSLDPGNRLAEYFLGTFEWHLDGTMDDIPSKASVLTAHVIADTGGETEFASTYAAYDRLTDAEKKRCCSLRVVHTFEASQRRIYHDPSADQLADWGTRSPKEHPLVWEHQSGRRSLVLGATASHVVGLDSEEGKKLLEDLLARATAPDLVFRHQWSVGDTVIWDNRGVVHRVCPYDSSSRREMHRTTLVGDEPIR